MRSARPYLCAAVLALAACGGGGSDAPTAGAADGDGSATPATPTPPPQPTGDGRSTLVVELDRAGAREDVSRVELRLLGVALWLDATPTPVTNGKPCDLEGAEWHAATARVPLDLASPGTSPLATLDTAREGELTEVRLFVRGTLDRGGREYDLNGDELCVGSDRQDVAVVRVHPTSRLVLLDGKDYRLTMRFDAREQVRVDRYACSGDAAGAWVPHECRDPDDREDDGDPATRLRYQLVGEGTFVAAPLP